MLSAVLLILFSSKLLWGAGALLVHSEAPQKADAALVLGGDYKGGRIRKAAELWKMGYVPVVLVSGAGSLYGAHESDLEIAYILRQGYPATAFRALRYPALSTEDEIRSVTPVLREMGARKVLLVTSPSHTGRSTRVFHREAPGIEVHPVASEDPFWQHGFWWKNREGRKTFAFETLKTIAYAAGI